MTTKDLLAFPEDDAWRYELVEGVLVRMAGSRPKAMRVSTRLLLRLGNFVEEHELGAITGADAVYDFEQTGQLNTGLLPDIGFYPGSMEARVQDDKPYPFAPSLAVEVASPLQTKRDMAAKVARYLRGGTQLVWVIYPHTLQIDVWHQGDEVPTITLQHGDTLDGEDVVPGFRIPVTPLFD